MSWRRVLTTWLMLAVAMSANGILREVGLKAVMRPAAAGVVSAALGVGIILLVTRLMFRPLRGASTARLAVISGVFVVFTVAFEFAVGRLVDHKSWGELLGNYAIWRGNLWPALLALVALTPFIWGRWFSREEAFERRYHDGQTD